MCVSVCITPHILAIFTNTENSPLFSHYHFVEDNLNILEVFKTSNNRWLGRPPHRSHCSTVNSWSNNLYLIIDQPNYFPKKAQNISVLVLNHLSRALMLSARRRLWGLLVKVTTASILHPAHLVCTTTPTPSTTTPTPSTTPTTPSTTLSTTPPTPSSTPPTPLLSTTTPTPTPSTTPLLSTTPGLKTQHQNQKYVFGMGLGGDQCWLWTRGIEVYLLSRVR